MNDRTHRLIPAVWVLLENDKNQIYLLKRANTGWQDGRYCIPSGHIEQNESPVQAGAREVLEETGVVVQLEDLEFKHVMFNKSSDGTDTERVSVFFVAKRYQGIPTNAEPEKASEGAWFDLDKLPELTSTNQLAFDAIARGDIYSDVDY